MNPLQQKRLAFWEHNRETAMMALATVGNVEGLMIIIADMRDAVGKPLTDHMAQIKGTDARTHFEKTAKKGEIPTAIMILPIESVAKILSGPNPTVSGVLRQGSPARDCLWVAVIAEGGTMLIQTPNCPEGPAGVRRC